MGRRRYPPLTPDEVASIVRALGFVFDRQCGSHANYERRGSGDEQRRVVTIDTNVDEFDERLIKSMIRQSGASREQFYGATRRTGKKI